ncbi:Mitogen-activated protein kinase kinase kinase 20 [Linum perenne]
MADMQWTRGNRLGKGGQAEVFKVIHNYPHLPPMAVKSAPIDKAASLFNERDILLKFSGAPGIIQCFGGAATSPSSDGTTPIYDLFLEYAADGSLTDLIARYRVGMPERYVRVCTLRILSALSLIHSNGYTHCDVKPDNVLVFPDQGGRLKLSDFGLAVKTQKAGDVITRSKHLRGTLAYMAPEVVVEGRLSPAVDVWSLGCTVVQMLTGEEPWSRCKDDWDLITEVVNGGHPEIPDWLCEEAKDFLKRCFVTDPSCRLSAESLLQHPFITSVGKVHRTGGNTQIQQRMKQRYLSILPPQIMQHN